MAGWGKGGKGGWPSGKGGEYGNAYGGNEGAGQTQYGKGYGKAQYGTGKGFARLSGEMRETSNAVHGLTSYFWQKEEREQALAEEARKLAAKREKEEARAKEETADRLDRAGAGCRPRVATRRSPGWVRGPRF